MTIEKSVTTAMRPRVVVFIAIAVALASLFVRLGFWQLDRLAWRRALNAEVAQHITEAPVSINALPRDSAAMRYRRVQLTGTFDYANEIVITQRIRGGSPGVNLLTPLRIPGRDSAYLVNRGWVYSPDGKGIENAKWREADTATVLAFALPAPSTIAHATGVVSPKIMRSLDFVAIQKGLPYPLARVQLVQLGDTSPAAGIPPRLQPPAPSEGPHKSYAVQWFSFATIAIFGAGIFAYNDRHRNRPRVDNT